MSARPTGPDGREEAPARDDGHFRQLGLRLEEREVESVPADAVSSRAAVALLLTDPGRRDGLRTLTGLEAAERPPAEIVRQEGSLPRPWGSVHVLLILRTRVEGDPWAGHVALPGGKREAGDRDLMATALRETAEETGLVVAREDVLGRLSDLYPRSAHLPDLAIRPFVARWRGRGELAFNFEVDDGFWVPLTELADPGRRSHLVLERSEGRRRFPTIEVGEHTVWGLTHAIVQEFLATLTGLEGASGG